MKKKIAIIGAGIAGLTFANFIKKNSDFEFMVYEKEEKLSLDGFGIQLSTNSISILNKIGFDRVQQDKICHPQKINFFSITNNKICDIKINEFNREKIKYTTLQRSTLIEFLKEEIYTQHLRFGKCINKILHQKDKIQLNFEDNTIDLVDYLIIADGIFSKTKSFFEKDQNTPEYKNAIAVRAILKSKKNLNIDEKNINLFMGSNAHLVIYPMNNTGELNLVCIIREKKFDPNNVQNIINKKVLSQNFKLKDLFKGNLKYWPLYASSKVVPSSDKKVFYLGDALHGFLPTMAQGASQSIEGAYELYNLLKNNDKNAHEIYFKNRLRRVKVIKKRSDLNFFTFHVSNSIIQNVRNIILKKLVKSRGFISKYLGEVYEN